MKGEILHFDQTAGSGLILGDNGNRYDFSLADLKGEDFFPLRGNIVDFIPQEGRAVEVYALGQSYSSSASESSFKRYFVDTLMRKYATVRGRSTRSEFWFFMLYSVIISLVIGVLDVMIFGGEAEIQPLSLLYSLIILAPSIGVGVRRLHDIGRSGWWYLLWFIPVIGWIVLIVWWCMDSQKGINRFGRNPKES